MMGTVDDSDERSGIEADEEAPVEVAVDKGAPEDSDTEGSERAFAATGCDPQLARALREQFESALAITGSSVAVLAVTLIDVPLRAHVGAPPGDCEAIAESGFDSEQIIVSELESDPRVPSTWRGRGFAASLSSPVEVHGRQVGALHIVDTKPREYSEEHCEAMADICYMIGRRLEKFLGPEREERRESLMCRAVSPAFAELRNALVPLNLGTSDLRIVAADLSPVIARLADSADSDDKAATIAYEDLVALIEEISRAATRVREVVMVVEDLWGEGGRVLMLGEVLSTAAGLALHSTRLVGGVTMPEVPNSHAIVGRRSVAVSSLSLLLSRAAEANASGVTSVTPLAVKVCEEADHYIVEVHGESLDEEEAQKISEEVDDLLLGDSDLGVSQSGATLYFRFTRAP